MLKSNNLIFADEQHKSFYESHLLQLEESYRGYI